MRGERAAQAQSGGARRTEAITVQGRVVLPPKPGKERCDASTHAVPAEAQLVARCEEQGAAHDGAEQVVQRPRRAQEPGVRLPRRAVRQLQRHPGARHVAQRVAHPQSAPHRHHHQPELVVHGDEVRGPEERRLLPVQYPVRLAPGVLGNHLLLAEAQQLRLLVPHGKEQAAVRGDGVLGHDVHLLHLPGARARGSRAGGAGGGFCAAPAALQLLAAAVARVCVQVHQALHKPLRVLAVLPSRTRHREGSKHALQASDGVERARHLQQADAAQIQGYKAGQLVKLEDRLHDTRQLCAVFQHLFAREVLETRLQRQS
mmetsp:Transcript_28932/g.55403  ORF Transcript_28932/g.55403 Transcript_28932/m.55403 type:complete len:316 (-) Transcript_28932:683-1630(-)